jgi:uncharacterized membrane protein YeiB
MTQAQKRIDQLDALRGFALAGIVMFNIVQMTHMPRPTGEARDHVGAYVWELLFIQRPFPIFSLLFGISFALFLRSAERRTDRPRLVLLRRLIWLGIFGALHTLIQPGEVLKFYAIGGIVVLLPATYLSRRWHLWLGLVLLLVAALTFNGVAIIPGLFLLGMAITEYAIPDTLEQRGRQLAIAFAIAVPLAAGAAVLQWRAGVGPPANFRILPMGLVFASLYTVGFLLLMRTPARRVLDAVFAPMGRMALTNYILASFLIVAADRMLDIGARTQFDLVIYVGIAIGVVQAIISPIWLRYYRYGPLEWVWRRLTWWEPVPNRRPEYPEKRKEPTA